MKETSWQEVAEWAVTLAFFVVMMNGWPKFRGKK